MKLTLWQTKNRGNLNPIWFLLTFCMLLLFYRGAINSRIPLYISNTATANTLATIAIQMPDLRFLDIGAGIASVLIPLAKARPDAHFTGIENAPATWLIGRLRTGGLTNCDWRWGDLWATDFRHHNVVYAFLSPAPMAALWEKIQREMPSGSVFISNSFAVPNIAPNKIIEVDDVRQTRLYCYQL
jgi:hypothetical protein